MNESLIGGFTRYLNDELERSPGTVRQYVYRLHLIEQLVGKPIEEVTAAELRELKLRLKGNASPSHIKGLLVAARQFHSWGALEERWPVNGISHLRMPREESRLASPLPPERCRTLLLSCRNSLETRVIYCGLLAGLRIAESASLQPWSNGWLRVFGKGRKWREVPVHPFLDAVGDALFSHPTPHKAALQKAKERVEKRAGFPFVAHQLRKSFSTSLHDAGVSDLCRRELLGHSLGLDGVYTAVSRREKEEAIARLHY